MVGFIMAVTTIQGSTFSGVYKIINESSGTEMNITWITLWFYVEFTVYKSRHFFPGKGSQVMASNDTHAA